MKRILTILLLVLPCFGQTNNTDMVVTLLTPTNGSVFATVITTDGTVSNIIQLTASVSFKEKLAAPVIDRIR